MYSIQTMPKLFSYFFMNSKSERKKIRRERFVISTLLIFFYYYYRQKKSKKGEYYNFVLNSSTFNLQQQKNFKLWQKVQTVIIPIQAAL